jgi:predicted nucleic acid-binding protein
LTDRFLVDTNVLSEARKGRRAHAGVSAFFERADDASLHVSVLTLGEIHRGIEGVRRRDPSAARALSRWLSSIEREFGDRILPIDSEIAATWGALDAAGPLPVVDGLLAATALVRGLTLVTRNVRDVKRTGVKWLDPFSEDAE